MCIEVYKKNKLKPMCIQEQDELGRGGDVKRRMERAVFGPSSPLRGVLRSIADAEQPPDPTCFHMGLLSARATADCWPIDVELANEACGTRYPYTMQGTFQYPGHEMDSDSLQRSARGSCDSASNHDQERYCCTSRSLTACC